MPSSPLAESSANRAAILREDFEVGVVADAARPSDMARKRLHVFVAAPGDIQDHQFIFFHFRRAANQFRQGMRGFERRNNTFYARQDFCRGDRFAVPDRRIFGAALLRRPGMFWAHAGVVEPGGNRMGRRDLAVETLQNVSVSALQYAGARATETTFSRESRGVLSKSLASASRFDTQHFHRRVGNKGVKKSDGIGAAAHASDQSIRKSAFGF